MLCLVEIVIEIGRHGTNTAVST